jgi:hypothetical protein
MRANRLLIIFLIYGIGSIFLITTGCGTSKVAMQNAAIIELHRPVVVEKTGMDKRPDWTSEKPFLEDDQGFHFTGGYMGGADYALTLRLAKSEATKNLLESIEIKARSEFSSAINGQNRIDGDLGRYITDAVAWTVENLRVRGIQQNQIYYEQVFDPTSQSFKYNSWVQLIISKFDYQKAKVEATQRLLDKAIQEKDKKAKEKAMELLEKLREET